MAEVRPQSIQIDEAVDPAQHLMEPDVLLDAEALKPKNLAPE